MRTHAVTDVFGRYYLLLPQGDTFDIQVELPTPTEAFTSVYKHIYHTPKGYFNQDIQLSGATPAQIPAP